MARALPECLVTRWFLPLCLLFSRQRVLHTDRLRKRSGTRLGMGLWAATSSGTIVNAIMSEKVMPHPLLTRPEIFLSNLPGDVSDAELARALSECHPVKIEIQRAFNDAGEKHGAGKISFDSVAKAEKALATLPSLSMAFNDTCISSSSIPTAAALPHSPPGKATARVIYPFLPDGAVPAQPTAGQIHDALRPLGPLHSVSVWYEPLVPRSEHETAPGLAGWRASVEFCDEGDARRWHAECERKPLCGWQMSVALRQAKPSPEQIVSAVQISPRDAYSVSHLPLMPGQLSPQLLMPSSPPFCPHLPPSSYWDIPALPGYTSHSAPAATSGGWLKPPSPTARILHKGPGRTLQAVSLDSHVGERLIDVNNLYVTNIDTDINAHQLEAAFRPFGQIVSAQIMRNALTDVSRGFGFVSYREPHEAQAALQAMDGRQLGNQKLAVQFHSPKTLRLGRDDRPGLARRATAQQVTETAIDGPLESAVDTMTLEDDSHLSERERLLAAVAAIDLERSVAITELLIGLTARERAMSVFSSVELGRKVAAAQRVLEAEAHSALSERLPVPLAGDLIQSGEANKGPEASLIKSASYSAPVATLEALLRLPVDALWASLTADGGSFTRKFGLAPPRAGAVQEAEGWIAEHEGLPERARKQRLGELIFALLKGNGVKKPAFVTVRLVDDEPLNDLCRVMFAYPAVLVQRALLPAADARATSDLILGSTRAPFPAIIESGKGRSHDRARNPKA